MYYPSLDEIRGLTSQGNLCPIYREILADLETPVSAYLKIAHGPYSFLLESIEGGEHIARYSFLGSTPYLVLRLDRGTANVVEQGDPQTFAYTDPLVVLGSYLRDYRPVRLPNMPLFVGGAIGYLSYETVTYFEERLPRLQASDYAMPEGVWMFVDTLLVFDHLRHKIKVVAHVRLDAPDLEAEYAAAVARIDEMIRRLRQPLPAQQPLRQPGARAEPAAIASNLTREQYVANVARAGDYIMAGDIFQVVPSQRFRRPTAADSFTIYRALRTINPSPYMFYLHTGEGELVGSSPELLVRVIDGTITTHPIAGTRPRGTTEAQDEELAAELLADEKELAEHLMLVDLGRNDIGRVSQPGTVRVPIYMQVEKYSHVMHIVSHVTGTLREDMQSLDALRSCFPAGTVSGAPKIRAMEIISELEGTRRDIYAGCVGYVGFNGNIDTCISLRTMVVKDGVAYVQAGGGVVADSDPAMEYQESANKAAALLKAIELAEELL